MLNSHYTS